MPQGPSFPFEISFPDTAASNSVKELVIDQLGKIESLYDRVVSCHISIRALHTQPRNRIYFIKINLKVPGTNLIVDQETKKRFGHSDVYEAIRDAFSVLERQIRKRLTHLNDHSMSEEKPQLLEDQA